MTLDYATFSPDLTSEWDSFVEKANNGTIFHLRKFLNYHPAGRFTDSSLVFTKKNVLCAVAPAVVRDFEDERVFHSHPGASYGGVVLPADARLDEIVEFVDILIQNARMFHCNRIIMTVPPIYYNSKYSSYVDFALFANGFSYRIRELSSVVDLQPGPEQIYYHFPDTVKRAIRKAEREGVLVKESDDIKPYYNILKNNLEMRHNVKPTHTLEELEYLHKLFPERIKLYAAEFRDEMIGGIVTFACNPRVNLAFYIAHNHSFQSVRPVDSIIWHLIQESYRQGFSYLDFGTFTLRMQPNWGLCRFKEKFGACGIFRDTFERRV